MNYFLAYPVPTNAHNQSSWSINNGGLIPLPSGQIHNLMNTQTLVNPFNSRNSYINGNIMSTFNSAYIKHIWHNKMQ